MRASSVWSGTRLSGLSYHVGQSDYYCPPSEQRRCCSEQALRLTPSLLASNATAYAALLESALQGATLAVSHLTQGGVNTTTVRDSISNSRSWLGIRVQAIEGNGPG
jgi:hypothetical protein